MAIFFLAFLPQFIVPEAPHKTLAFLLLGCLFTLVSIPVNMGWALTAAWLARRVWVRQSRHVLDRVAGVMFLGFGLRLALSDNPSR